MPVEDESVRLDYNTTSVLIAFYSNESFRQFRKNRSLSKFVCLSAAEAINKRHNRFHFRLVKS